MSLGMDPQIRARWTTALRSGQYLQASGQLRKGAGFCCLGVLCDLAAADGVTNWDRIAPAQGYLPGEVIRWAGLDQADPILLEADDAHDCESAAGLNDEGMPFTEIADLIDGGTS